MADSKIVCIVAKADLPAFGGKVDWLGTCARRGGQDNSDSEYPAGQAARLLVGAAK